MILREFVHNIPYCAAYMRHFAYLFTILRLNAKFFEYYFVILLEILGSALYNGCNRIRIMKIAILTKPVLWDNPARAKLLAALKSCGDFDIVEVPAGGDIPSDCERLLVFGGDGTMLDAAVKCARVGVPLVGVNLGNLGFLTGFESEADPERVADALLNGEVRKRMLLGCKSAKGNFLALNDFVLKSADTRPVTVKLFVDGSFVDSYRSDGVIVATPTGSTAYSLSAGGPVMAPELDAIVVNPVCPHTLHSRPLVVGGNSEIRLELSASENAVLVTDGNKTADLGGNSVVMISKSPLLAPFIVTDGHNFYEKLLDKMNRWGTTP